MGLRAFSLQGFGGKRKVEDLGTLRVEGSDQG